jgi:hypothetical protein
MGMRPYFDYRSTLCQYHSDKAVRLCEGIVRYRLIAKPNSGHKYSIESC